MPHPVRLMGNAISYFTKKWCDNTKNHRTQIFKGALMVCCMIILSAALPALILYICYKISKIVYIIVQSFMCYQILSTKCLKDESMKVYKALIQNDTEGARYAVSMIVGRDTNVLDERGITKAAVETVAENTSDGTIAPLFYMLFFGAAGGFVYKAINTMDSMTGYKNDKFLYFGRAAAKCDDVVNYIPSRIAALLMIFAAGICNIFSAEKMYSMSRAAAIFRRDRYKHASPNSAQTESVCAGALGIMLAGDASYFGKIVRKPTIGDAVRDIEPKDIVRADRLLYVTSWLMLLIGIVLRMIMM